MQSSPVDDPVMAPTDLRSGAVNVAIVGGGISGLAAAHRLREIDPRISVSVLEAGPRPGGVLRTTREGEFLIEASADSFLTAVPWGVDLCRRIGLGDRLVPTDPDRRRAFVVRRGRLVPIPDGLMVMAPSRLWPVVASPILSPWGKLRLAAERFVPPGPGGDESLRSFAVRRFGREAFDRLIQPLVSGMYTGDPTRLSLEATMPRFLEMEREWGSLIRAVGRGRGGRAGSEPSGSGARYGMFVAPRGGMSEMVQALVARLPAGSVRCGVRVSRLERLPGGRWWIAFDSLGREAITADAVILATPAREAARLLRGIDPGLAVLVGGIESAGCAVVSLGYRRDQVGHRMDGFGFVVPAAEGRSILSGSFASRKFPGRSPEEGSLIRVFLGGALRPDLIDLTDDELTETAHRELARLLRIRGVPLLRRLDRWPAVMPQYHVGHLDRVRSIEGRAAGVPGLELAGNAYRGVGVPHCIRSGEEAAGRIAAGLVGASSAVGAGVGHP